MFGNRIANRHYEQRHCKICEVKNPLVMGNHDTEYHRERKPGYRPNSNTEDKQQVAEQSSNKANTAYFNSGANKHFFKEKPDDISPYSKATFVSNANRAKDPILGSGTISLGYLKLKDLH